MSSDEAHDEADVTAGAIADRSYPTVPSDRGLDFALDAMVSAGVDWVNRLVGLRQVRSRTAGLTVLFDTYVKTSPPNAQGTGITGRPRRPV